MSKHTVIQAFYYRDNSDISEVLEINANLPNSSTSMSEILDTFENTVTWKNNQSDISSNLVLNDQPYDTFNTMLSNNTLSDVSQDAIFAICDYIKSNPSMTPGYDNPNIDGTLNHNLVAGTGTGGLFDGYVVNSIRVETKGLDDLYWFQFDFKYDELISFTIIGYVDPDRFIEECRPRDLFVAYADNAEDQSDYNEVEQLKFIQNINIGLKGKNYDGTKQIVVDEVYGESGRTQIFYVWYNKSVVPSLEQPDVKIAIKNKIMEQEQLDDKIDEHLEQLNNKYPKLFVVSTRLIYPWFELRPKTPVRVPAPSGGEMYVSGEAISLTELNTLKNREFGSYADVEVIFIKGFTTPLIVSTGISDVVPYWGRDGAINAEHRATNMLAYLQYIMAYLTGEMDSMPPEISNEIAFTDADQYLVFNYAGTEWKVDKNGMNTDR